MNLPLGYVYSMPGPLEQLETNISSIKVHLKLPLDLTPTHHLSSMIKWVEPPLALSLQPRLIAFTRASSSLHPSRKN